MRFITKEELQALLDSTFEDEFDEDEWDKENINLKNQDGEDIEDDPDAHGDWYAVYGH